MTGKPAPMADDALTRKDAKMEWLTREQIAEIQDRATLCAEATLRIRGLCKAALLQHAPARVAEGVSTLGPESELGQQFLNALVDANVVPESPAKEQPGEPDAAAMVKRLRSYAERALLHECLPAMREAADLIEKLGQGWIPVTGRLPEKTGYYLARRHGEHVSELCAHSFDAKTGKWLFGDGSDVEEFPVEHWMPLPPPPKRP